MLDACAPACARPRRPDAPDAWVDARDRYGPAGLGLAREQAYLASPDWWILAQVARWLERERRGQVDDPQLATQLGLALRRADLGLPLPATDAAARYALAPSAVGAPTDAALFVIVGAEVRAGAVPRGSLRGGEVALAAAPSAASPARSSTTSGSPARSPMRPSWSARARRPPLLLLDANVDLARARAVLGALGRPRAEVAVATGGVAAGHPVHLERTSFENEASPVLAIRAGELTLEGYGDDRVATWASLDDELAHFAAVNAPVRKLRLRVDRPATAAELVRVLDACAAAHVDALVIP